jgi:hypothetical protein
MRLAVWGTSDFRLFGPLKKHLVGRLFATDVDAKQSVTSWLQILDIDSFYTMTQALWPRREKWLNVIFVEVEAWCLPSDTCVMHTSGVKRVLGIGGIIARFDVLTKFEVFFFFGCYSFSTDTNFLQYRCAFFLNIMLCFLTSINIYNYVWRNIPEDFNLQK